MSCSAEFSADDDRWEELMGRDVMILRLVRCSGDSAPMHTVVTCNLTGYVVGIDTSSQDAEFSSSNCSSSSSNKKVNWHAVPSGQAPFESLLRQTYKIGEGDAVPGIELALRHSRVGETLRVRCAARFAYGYNGRPAVASGPYTSPAIAPDSDLEYNIEILSHLSEGEIDPQLLAAQNDDHQLVDSDRHHQRLLALTELLQRKEAGNRWFTYSDFARAARAYSKATKVADMFFNGNATEKNNALMEVVKKTREEGEEEDAAVINAKANAELAALNEAEANKRRFETADERLLEVYVSCLNNMAACQLKLGEHTKAKEICVRVLEIQPNNLKALLRAAKAALATHCFEECDLCLQQLLHLAPVGSAPAAAAKVEKQALRQAKEQYRQSNKVMARNIAKNLFNNSRKEGKAVTSTGSYDMVVPSSESIHDGDGADDDYDSHRAIAEDNREQASHMDKDTLVESVTGRVDEVDGASSTPTNLLTAQAVASPTADLSLLLLLATSLLVLAVSVGLVLWANITPDDDQPSIPSGLVSENLSDEF